MQAEGAFIRYHSETPPCMGTVPEAEAWLLALAARLGIDEGEIEPIAYYRFDTAAVQILCGGASACAGVADGRITIYSSSSFDKHELIHALHLSVWDPRPPLLHEGLAVLFDDDFPQSFVLSEISENIDEFIEAETGKDNSTLYAAGASLSYWVLERHGTEGLVELWDQCKRGMSASEFRTVFELVTGESLDAMIEDVSGQPACQLTTCHGPTQAWDGQVWRMQTPGECSDEVAGGTEAGSYMSWHRLVEVSEEGLYELSTTGSEVEAILSACGDCKSLEAAGFAASRVFGDNSAQVFLSPGLYRVQAHWLEGASTSEIRLQPTP